MVQNISLIRIRKPTESVASNMLQLMLMLMIMMMIIQMLKYAFPPAELRHVIKYVYGREILAICVLGN